MNKYETVIMPNLFGFSKCMSVSALNLSEAVEKSFSELGYNVIPHEVLVHDGFDIEVTERGTSKRSYFRVEVV